MKLYVLLFIYFLFSCKRLDNKESMMNKSKGDKKSLSYELDNDPSLIQTGVGGDKQIYTETSSPEKFYIFLPERQVEVTIQQSYLSTYVTQIYPSGASTKYRDRQFSVKIKHKSQIVLDTILIKEDFLKYIDKENIENTILSKYYFIFGKDDPNRIEFNIEMDPSELASHNEFKHIFDVRNKTMKFYVQKGDVLFDIPKR